jgi:cysteine desulfurase/selenocysteine lyase
MIYLDNASTSFPKPPSVADAMISAVREVGANPGRGGYAKARAADRIVYETRTLAARLFGADDASRVIFTPGCTYSLNVAIKGLLKPGDHAVAGGRQHNAVVRTLESVGCAVAHFVWDGGAPVDKAAFERLLTPKTKAVIINQGSNVDGLLFPLDEIRGLIKNVPLIVDCAQTAGVLELKAGENEIFCAPGHKGLWGAAGIGLLAFGKKVELEPVYFGGTGSFSEDAGMPTPYPDRLEPGTLNLPGIASLNAGIKEVVSAGIKNIFEKEIALATKAFERLSKIGRVRIFWPENPAYRLPLFSFTVEGMDPSDMANALNYDFDMACRTGLHCAPQAHEELGTYPAGTIRFSPGYFTTTADVDAFANAVAQIAKKNG